MPVYNPIYVSLLSLLEIILHGIYNYLIYNNIIMLFFAITKNESLVPQKKTVCLL